MTNKKVVRFKKTRPNAIMPFKARETDSGFDLTLLELVKTNGKVEMYSTGIAVQHTNPGWYFDMVPRSSLIKTGYILANSVGVIDHAYIGEIMVPLIKIDNLKPDILAEGPVRAVQLIPRQVEHFDFVQVEELEDTDRGTGGFGSSGVK